MPDSSHFLQLSRAPGRLAALLTAGALVLAAGGCSSDDEAGADGRIAVHMATGSTTATITLPAQVALAKGYFADEGLDATIDDVKAGSKALQATVSGQVEVGIGFYEHTIQSQVKGQDLRAFAAFTTMPGLGLVVSPKYADRIRTIADLKGQAVGVSGPGSATDAFLKAQLAKAGLAPDSASAVGIGIGPTSVAAVQSGKVAAAVLYDPALTEVTLATPAAPLLADARDPARAQELFGVAKYPSTTLYAKPSWLAEHADTARRLTAAILKANDFLRTASIDEIVASLPKESVGPDPERYKKVMQATVPYISADGKYDPAGVEAVLKVMKVIDPKIAAANVDLTKTYTNEYLPAG